jgi:hypothetical protein
MFALLENARELKGTWTRVEKKQGCREQGEGKDNWVRMISALVIQNLHSQVMYPFLSIFVCKFKMATHLIKGLSTHSCMLNHRI